MATIPNQYRTSENGDYGIVTCQLREGDWIATTREFKAFGKTEADAIAKLGRFLQEAGESIIKLAHKMMRETLKHPTDPPHCSTCGDYGCTKHKEAVIE